MLRQDKGVSLTCLVLFTPFMADQREHPPCLMKLTFPPQPCQPGCICSICCQERWLHFDLARAHACTQIQLTSIHVPLDKCPVLWAGFTGPGFSEAGTVLIMYTTDIIKTTQLMLTPFTREHSPAPQHQTPRKTSITLMLCCHLWQQQKKLTSSPLSIFYIC